MNFKEQLRELADRDCDNLDISGDIECIKSKMTKFYSSGVFTIEVINPDPTKQIVIGSQSGCPLYMTFVPKNINPTYYRDLLVKEFNKLGFTQTDIALKEQVYKDYISYKIILTW